MTMIDDLLAMQKRVSDLPPVPHAILCHHSVPYGRSLRQWDTRGRLFVWVNRGMIADVPRAKSSATAGLFGIPVVNV